MPHINRRSEKMKIKMFLVYCLLVLTVLLPGSSFAGMVSSWDLKTDWSNGDNPNNLWAFWYGKELLPWTDSFLGSQGAFAKAPWPATDHVPVWFQSISSAYDYQTGDILVHPTSHSSSSTYVPTSVTWTSPMDGQISITGGVWWGGMNSQERYSAWTLYLNGSALDSGLVGSPLPFTRSNPDNISGGGLLDVKFGDTLTLVFTERDPDHYGWNTGVNLTINAAQNPVPVPSALFLFFSGIGLIAGLKRKF